MPMSRSFHHRNRVYAALVVATLLLAPQPLDAEKRPDSGRIATGDLSGIEVVDVLNLFSNVGSLIYFVEPNAVGLPPGIISQCTGTLIHERAFLVAGHCTSQTQPGLPPFVKPYVPLSPNALDQSEQASRVTWLRGRSTAFSSRLDRSDEVPDRYRADSNWLLGYSPDLPGCIATANTRDEIEQEMKAAIAFHLDSLKAEGMAIPKPSSSSSYVEIPV
jgi:predicted RNase H-like HicB family nuclease